ncbi:hypothetical protein Cni_G20382 [Canna indica]|uniref:Nudix hydrolase domain-containing protein n=1 Tax=Canna indica TaxID=4628 RepID=A0AAQ3KR70_9LILI|nr:hypothetical protein Cni_G20382 [Canna indica]
MVCLTSRQGRQFQRYSKSGSRLVVGCIPYKFTGASAGAGELDKSMKVLVISSTKGNGLLFPKGGWENDETIKQAASREALEEAGVQGSVEHKLGKWKYKSRTYDTYHEGIMFPMHVTKEFGEWPEMHARYRKWVSVGEAKEGCQHLWMKEALEILVTLPSNLALMMRFTCLGQYAKITSNPSFLPTVLRSSIEYNLNLINSLSHYSLHMLSQMYDSLVYLRMVKFFLIKTYDTTFTSCPKNTTYSDSTIT